MNKEKIQSILDKTRGVTLVAATKYLDSSGMKELLSCGISNFGENRTDAFLKKYDELKGEPVTWHFIGHLQKNKARDVINKISCLHSLDSLELAKIIQKERETPLNVFIEVKLSDSETKSGISEEELPRFLGSIKNYDKINVLGLMVMSEKEMTHEEKYNMFKKAVDFGKIYGLKEYSMGMSSDYEDAIKAGTTCIRLGRILLED